MKALKAKGYIFNRWNNVLDYSYIRFDLDLKNPKPFEDNYGDIMLLTEFIDDCKSGGFIDYDGHAGEILLDGKLVYDKSFLPSDVLFFKKKLEAMNQSLDNKLEIVWYNK